MRLFPFLVPLLLVGCVEDLEVPKVGTDEVSLELSVSTRTLKLGAVDTIRVRVVNNLNIPVRLTFPTTCQVVVTVRNRAGNVVAPRDGRPQCLPVQSQLTLAIGASQVFTTLWSGGFDFAPPDTPDKVPPGTYFVYAEMVARGYSTLAPAFSVEVTQ